MKEITTIKGLLGAWFFLNAVTIFTLTDKVNNTDLERYLTIPNLILAVVSFYYAFKLATLVQTSFRLVYFTIWFGVIYSIIAGVLTTLHISWTIFYVVISAIIIINLNKVKKSI